MKQLNHRQRIFISEYLKTGNPIQAYIRAGYSPKSADTASYRLLSNPTIQRAIDEGQRARNQRLQLEEDYELIRAIELLDRCMKPNQVRDGYGKPITDSNGRYVLRFDSSGANSALMIICKLRGKFKDKKEIPGDIDRAQFLAEALKDLPS